MEIKISRTSDGNILKARVARCVCSYTSIHCQPNDFRHSALLHPFPISVWAFWRQVGTMQRQIGNKLTPNFCTVPIQLSCIPCTPGHGLCRPLDIACSFRFSYENYILRYYCYSLPQRVSPIFLTFFSSLFVFSSSFAPWNRVYLPGFPCVALRAWCFKCLCKLHF